MTTHFSWQSAVLKSDCKSTTKLVLLVIGTYMNQHGGGAFPSYNTVAESSSLNRATVIEHIRLAIESGWLKKSPRFNQDGDCESNIYAIAFPAEVVVQDDHPSRLGQPPLVVQDDPNTPSLTPQLTPHKNIGIVLPDWLPEESWKGFQEMRKKIKKPMTDRAIGLMLKKLNEFRSSGHDIAQILDESTVNNWQSIYAPKAMRKQHHGYEDKQAKNKAFMDVLTGRSDNYDANDPFTIDITVRAV